MAHASQENVFCIIASLDPETEQTSKATIEI